MQSDRHVADFVEKQGASMGRFDEAGLAAPPRAGECAFVVAKEFGLEQALGNCGAVHRHEGLGRAATGAVNALGDHLLAGAAVSQNQHSGIAGRVLVGELAHALCGGTLAHKIANAPAHAGTALALVGAQIAVGALNHRGVAAHQQGTGHDAVFDQRRAAQHQGANRQLHDFFAALLPIHGLILHEHGRDFGQQSAVQLLYRAAKQRGHALVECADAALVVDGDHTILQLAQHGFEPLMAIAFRAAVPGQQQRVVERLLDCRLRVQEHAGNTRLLRKIGHQPRSDDSPHIGGLQLLHAGGRIFHSVIDELGHSQPKQRVELREQWRRRVIGHQSNAGPLGRGLLLGTHQRFEQSKPAHFDHGDRNFHLFAYQKTAGSRRHQRIDGLTGVERAHRLHRLVERCADMRHPRRAAPLLCHGLHDAANAVPAHGHDVRELLAKGQRESSQRSFSHEIDYFTSETSRWKNPSPNFQSSVLPQKKPFKSSACRIFTSDTRAKSLAWHAPCVAEGQEKTKLAGPI